jgi:hypothetical protein
MEYLHAPTYSSEKCVAQHLKVSCNKNSEYSVLYDTICQIVQIDLKQYVFY